jgi:hypothetical protein
MSLSDSSNNEATTAEENDLTHYTGDLQEDQDLDLEGPEELNRQLEEGGLYPDIDDDYFLVKLLAKREFKESKQEKITDKMLEDDVCVVKEFEYTPVQRFIAQFMSPKTPYNGMLLYHGVGVGKTCTAVLTAEAFLELSPKNKVYILAPPAIQAGFYRTIFDINRLNLGEDEDTPNSHTGCTGNRYLELTQTYYDREKKDIELRVNRLINKRYAIMGYVAFRNMIRDILSKIPPALSKERQSDLEVTLLKRAFSGCLFIVDEAHNMRDVLESAADADESAADADESAADERSDASAGKKLAPQLRRVLRTCDGIKLLLMTATPMYNNYKEIIPLLNFLLHADHADDSMLLSESDIQFEMTEDGERLTQESEEKIMRVANGHVSFMRGENPRAFPARLDPSTDLRLKAWPDATPNGTTRIEPQSQKTNALRLPLIECPLYKDSFTVIHTLTSQLVAAKGVGIRTIDTLLQAGNCVFPGEGTEGRTGTEGFQSCFSANAIPGTFEGVRLSTLPQYTTPDPTSNITWMATGKNNLQRHSPKFNSILQTIQKSEGVSFVYSRFVENGAVIFCLLLEANGYTPWGRSAPLFRRGIAVPGGRQCSKCEKREAGHPPLDPSKAEARDNHSFSPAYYALLTASSINTSGKDSLPLSPNNNGVINAARDPKNLYGTTIKVIVGSQVAGEGLDLKAIRAIHILEGWFHLSKEEQIVGRGIRYCSHNGLPKEKRNCTINLYVNTFPAEINKETIDLYTYRTAMNKAVRIGNVSRALKQGSSDCNLNRDAILVSGLQSVRMIDSMGVERDQNLNDRDFTPICDWIRCSYECKPAINFKVLEDDLSTYYIYAARFAEQELIAKLKAIFKEQTWYRWADIQKMFPDIPETILLGLLTRIVENKSIKFSNGAFEGYIIYRNDLFLFQPNTIQDTHIPIALRYGRYPIKKDSYEPTARIQQTLGATKTKPAIKVAGLSAPAGVAAGEPQAIKGPPPFTRPDMALVKAFWIEANNWIDSWNYDTVPAVEGIPATLSKAIIEYLEGDKAKKEVIETRLKKLQWWGRSIGAVEGGLEDLKKVGRQYIWDNFIKAREQIGLLQEGVPYQDVAGDEQIVVLDTITAFRLLDVETKKVLYICGDRFCADSLIQQFEKSKTDPFIATRANQRVSAEVYGFTVPWEGKDIMFKTNVPKPEGSAPAGGAACSIVSNVTGHRKKIVLLGEILNRFTGSPYDLTEEILTVTRKMSSAINYCALMEIVMRWMDIRRARYGNLRYFYRPISSFYSGHKEKK